MRSNPKPSRTARRTVETKQLPAKYLSESLSQVDKRYAVARRLKSRLKDLIEVAGADSPQKFALCEEIIFLQYQLECEKVRIIETGCPMDGVYVQSVNALSGLLSKLGLNLADIKQPELKSYLSDEDDD